MQTPRAMHRGRSMRERAHGNCLIRPGLFALVFTAIILGFGPSVRAQIGNLDWASGKKAVKHRKQIDYENVKFRVIMEPGIGKHKSTHTYEATRYDGSTYTVEHKDSDPIPDLAIGGVYSAFQTPGDGLKVDFSIYVTVGANVPDFEFGDIHLLGVAAPEIGITPPGGNIYFRPFVSFGPGVSVLDNMNDKTFNLVGVLRGGIEVGSRKGPIAGTLAIKRIGHGETDNPYGIYSNGSKNTYSEHDLLLTLGLRYKIAL